MPAGSFARKKEATFGRPKPMKVASAHGAPRASGDGTHPAPLRSALFQGHTAGEHPGSVNFQNVIHSESGSGMEDLSIRGVRNTFRLITLTTNLPGLDGPESVTLQAYFVFSLEGMHVSV